MRANLIMAPVLHLPSAIRVQNAPYDSGRRIENGNQKGIAAISVKTSGCYFQSGRGTDEAGIKEGDLGLFFGLGHQNSSLTVGEDDYF